MQRFPVFISSVIFFAGSMAFAQDEAIDVEGPPPELTGLKAEAVQIVGDKQKLTQEIVDSLFSFSELGFQEFETQRYVTELLEETQASPSNAACQVFPAPGGQVGEVASRLSRLARMSMAFRNLRRCPALPIANQ